MSQYTTELKNLILQNFDIGLDHYPIFDEAYRSVLNGKIINEYYFREIGQETPERFKHYLNHTMDMIMPYYNKLYLSELIEINPILSKKSTEEFNRTKDTDTESNLNRTTTDNLTAAQTGNISDTGESTTTGSNEQSTDQTESGEHSSTGNTTNTTSQSVDGSSLTQMDTTANTTANEHVDETLSNVHTEDGFEVNSDTPGGMISVDSIKDNTWASSAKKTEGTKGDNAVNAKDTNSTQDSTSGTTTSGSRTETMDINASADQSLTGTQSGQMKVDSSNISSEHGSTTNEQNSLSNLTQDSTGQQEQSTTGKAKTLEDYIRTITEISGNQSEMLEKYRKTFLNIDIMIVKELNHLFMGVY